MDLQVSRKTLANGKPMIKLTKKFTGTVGRFNIDKMNLFLIEKNFRYFGYRREFILSIRLDGANKNIGEYKLTQMNLTEAELKELRNQIDNILNIR